MRLLRSLFVAAVMTTLFVPSLAAAQSSPVVQHYRAYRAALDRGDLPTAIAEAEAALAASEARDGDGGRTAVLALNLAMAHVMADNAVLALPLAERALSLANAGAEGVDPVMVELIVARATLATNSIPASAERLDAALQRSEAAALAGAELYAAAQQLGNWALVEEDYALAQRAWALAGRYPAGSVFGERYGLGRARTNEGIAIVLNELDRTRGRIGEDEGHEAHALLSEAVLLLHTLSQIESPTFELTLAQQTYAEARVWLLALESKLRADGRDVPDAPAEAQGDADGLSEVGPVDLTRPRCMMRVVAQPLPNYPRMSQVAAVMLFFRINAEGEIVSHQVVARAGSPAFAQAIERVISRWHVERRQESSMPNCRMEANILQSVSFEYH